MAGGSSSMGRPTAQKSNQEFVNSLRDNFEASIEGASYSEVNGHDSAQPTPKPDSNNWISWSKDGKTLEVPALDFTGSSLQEEREAYDITVKLFYLPGVSHTRREAQTREAIELVLKELHMPSVDLLIASFPGIYFDEKGEDCPDKIKSRGPIEAEPEPLGTQIETYKILEKLHDEGLVKRLGVSEFGADRLEPFLRQTRILPSVDQINLRDCCSVPEPLLSLAKGKEIELLVHNDSLKPVVVSEPLLAIPPPPNFMSCLEKQLDEAVPDSCVAQSQATSGYRTCLDKISSRGGQSVARGSLAAALARPASSGAPRAFRAFLMDRYTLSKHRDIDRALVKHPCTAEKWIFLDSILSSSFCSLLLWYKQSRSNTG
ncbi:hypothetical protein M8818_002055 [Zalaria obscura]|uniref:Uncharacterized protein n=1 Tax=Zalaria obscura TaxID=2024903 RepID=A0ACC3SJY8_9PEZI